MVWARCTRRVLTDHVARREPALPRERPSDIRVIRSGRTPSSARLTRRSTTRWRAQRANRRQQREADQGQRLADHDVGDSAIVALPVRSSAALADLLAGRARV